MTIFINKPIFSIKERDRLEPAQVWDILSFIHLVRLNLPVVCYLEADDIEKPLYEERGVYEWATLKDGTHGRLNVKLKLQFVPKDNFVHCTEPEFYTHRGNDYAQWKRSGWHINQHWQRMLAFLKEKAPLFVAPNMEEPPSFKTVKKTKEGWIVGNFPFPMTATDFFKIVKQKPWAFAPSPKFKSRADSVLRAEDMPFDLG
jgi:hypothetical protein